LRLPAAFALWKYRENRRDLISNSLGAGHENCSFQELNFMLSLEIPCYSIAPAQLKKKEQIFIILP
jgi:hypothetical protein